MAVATLRGRKVITLSWEETAQKDRENIYRYFFEQAGILLADKVDARFQEMAELLQETPYAGIKLKNNKDELYRKLIVPHFPFTLLYHYEKKIKNIRILRLLHTARQITSLY
ncbi:type II toxin-antitoxin system RelE/ParE family toxin [Salmonella enterica subsp. enterica serovar Enteritidis]|nr:type II toxin-antitoxin system RelE/ParE family toxin [Salmonella enterica subsp. enterica serovar Enteritidis]ECC9067009.1 type II toxin-antitoxin system RelE/ParE family toxin [Salmonella enterica subsp. diarizonae]ECY5112820.1 type II toxin-antitoxin system RelE/ParE family toxin [Salmonella enterica subsp. enterica serovar Typhimurium]EEM3073386.1 type II toxin-antitoxin system RelE/ParE family toxin [Salmonella enterica subsp. enterica serovar Java]ECZ9369411.1 type II toxin-antitoxin s